MIGVVVMVVVVLEVVVVEVVVEVKEEMVMVQEDTMLVGGYGRRPGWRAVGWHGGWDVLGGRRGRNQCMPKGSQGCLLEAGPAST